MATPNPTPGISIPDRSEWNTGLAVELEPQVRRVLAPNPSPFTFTGTQTYLVGSGRDVAVIDPGPIGTGEVGHADTNGDGHVDAILKAIAGQRLVAILCTHTHRDHSPAAVPLQAATGAPIIGCAPLVIDDRGARADAAFDPTYQPDRVLGDGELVAGDGWTLEAVATPGHTSNHLCFALRESGALFTGDHVMGWSTTVVSPPDGDMSAYMLSLQKLQGRVDSVYYPAHGPAVTKPQQLVRGMIGHRRQREAQILRVISEAPATIPEMVAQMYKGLDPRLNGAAGRSVLAHLIDLETQGRVARGPQVPEPKWTLTA
ncbi:MBL fold metallo-hydrolase [Novosphingobium sp. NDB2Meth1]|uniref:MBL fold metallo-hydrolase n=1 Tax=Novosphingobium sp. NDB2Meth1 TaxID=1892847 RepID=UPI000931FBFE|nr:MBL fold metallo-hydrolase [Novosphingobium sp. NDB2Meth1]